MKIKDKKNSISPSVAEKFVDQFYAPDAQFVDDTGNPVDVPVSGFLGLLASGYKGLAMVRKTKGQTHLFKKFTKGKRLAKRKPEK